MITRLTHRFAPALLLGCSATPETSSVPQNLDMPVSYEPLAPERVLARASLDLRGVRPSEDELDQVAADPTQLDTLIDAYLDDPRFEGRVQELFADAFLTRTDAYLVDVYSFDLTIREQERLQRDAGEEPVRIVARVVAEDRPIDEVVTADWTLANPLLAKVFPLDRPEGSGWKEARYTDGRPAAGVLATNGLWWRYGSTFSNANRKRANAISRILLCADFLSRPVTFDRTTNVLDEGAIEDSLRENPACAACHDTLDPLASFLYGFTWYSVGSDEVTRYHPSRERDWVDRTGQAPAYQGQAGDTLADLGSLIAADGRFEACMVRRVTESLWGRDLSEADDLTPHRDALRRNGRTLRPAMRSVLASPQYRAATDEGVAGGATPAKLASPALMASQIEDLTGFRWIGTSGEDLLTSDLYGYLTLAGGADGYAVSDPADAPNATVMLVHERLAETAASHVVRTFAAGGQAKLLDALDLGWRPDRDEEAMLDAISTARRRALGADDPDESRALLALWEALYALDDDPELAWTGTLSAILRDPDALLY